MSIALDFWMRSMLYSIDMRHSLTSSSLNFGLYSISISSMKVTTRLSSRSTHRHAQPPYANGTLSLSFARTYSEHTKILSSLNSYSYGISQDLHGISHMLSQCFNAKDDGVSVAER